MPEPTSAVADPKSDLNLLHIRSPLGSFHMASFLTNILASLTPPPVVTPEEYDGWQLRWKVLVFRPARMSFLDASVLHFTNSRSISVEDRGCSLAGCFVLHIARIHRSLYQQEEGKEMVWLLLYHPPVLTRVAHTYPSRLGAHFPIYEQQFSKPTKGGLISDGNSDFFVFSTGRRNVASLHTIFTLQPRHDFFQWLFQIGRTLVDLHYRPVDDVQLDFKLAPSALADNFVWAVVAKDELLSVKNNRWDLVRGYPVD